MTELLPANDVDQLSSEDKKPNRHFVKDDQMSDSIEIKLANSSFRKKRSLSVGNPDDEDVPARRPSSQYIRELLGTRSEEEVAAEKYWRDKFDLHKDEVLVSDWYASIVKGIRRSGRMYIFSDHVCFYSSTFGVTESIVIPFGEVTSIDAMHDNLIGDLAKGIKIKSQKDKFIKSYKFWTVTKRDRCLKDLREVWKGSFVVNEEQKEEEERLDLMANLKSSSTEFFLSSKTYSGSHDGFLGGEELVELLSFELPEVPPPKVFQLFFSDDSTFEHEYHESRGDSAIDVGSWSEHELFGKTRECKYTVQLSGPIGPPCSRNEEIQRYHLTRDRLILDVSMRMLDVPYSDYFTVETKWTVSRTESGGSLIKICAKAVFCKNTMLKSTISSRTISGMTESFKIWKNLAEMKLADPNFRKGSVCLRTPLETAPSQLKMESQDSSGPPKITHSRPMLSPPPPPPSSSTWLTPQHLQQILTNFLLLVLVILHIVLLTQVGSIAKSLRNDL